MGYFRSKLSVGLVFLSILLPTVALCGNSLVSSGTASFSPPKDCRQIDLSTQVVQACGFTVQENHSIIIELREAWEKTGEKDGEGVAKSVFRAMLWPEEYLEGMQRYYSEGSREKLIEFTMKDVEDAQTPEAAAKCMGYSYQVEDRSVPGHLGKLFIREERGMLCGAGAPGEDAMFAHETWISVSERYSPDLGQSSWPNIEELIQHVIKTFDLGYQ